MGAAFIDSFSRACGGSKSLAWLLTVNIAAGLLLMLATLLLHLFHAESGLLCTFLALPSDALTFAVHPWTLLTYMFTHLSLWHLIFNMLWLYWFGRMLSDIERPGTVTRLFIGGGITGGICYIAASAIAASAPGSFLTGSSAAVLAVMCATGMRMPSRTLNLFLIGEVKLKWIAIGAILLTLIGNYGIPTQAAHLGGVIFGAAWVLLRRRLSIPRRNAHGKRQTTRKPAINAKATVKAMQNAVPDHERLDQLLDKIRVSGYDSLSTREKNELNYISQRIEKE